MAKMMSPNTTIWWIPLAGIANYLAPTAAEITAGINISAAIVSGYTLAATDSDKDNSHTIVSEGNVDTPTFRNYAGKLSFFRDDLAGTSTVFTTAKALFDAGQVEGWLVSRHGYKSSVAPAASQLVSVYHFISDFGQDTEPGSGAPIEFTVPFVPQGQIAVNIPIV